MADSDDQVGEAIEEVVVLTLVYVELSEHPGAPAEDVFAEDFVLLVAGLQFLLLGHKQLVPVSLQTLVVPFAELFGTALTGQDLVFGDEAVVETILEVAQLRLERIDSFEGIIVQLIVFFHSLEDLIGVDDV